MSEARQQDKRVLNVSKIIHLNCNPPITDVRLALPLLLSYLNIEFSILIGPKISSSLTVKICVRMSPHSSHAMMELKILLKAAKISYWLCDLRHLHNQEDIHHSSGGKNGPEFRKIFA